MCYTIDMDNEVKVLNNRYEIGELIGQGGMADVFVGRDIRLNRQVAIKVLKQQFAEDPVFLARFQREAESAAKLNFPNIVSVYDSGDDITKDQYGTEKNNPYIVMELVNGKTLREILLTEGRLSIEDSAEVIINVLKALAYSHQSGIIHRDIKPANVMITNTGQVKVMDFGIARAVADAQNTMTQSQSVVGTAQYLSPEQARGETVDARSDLYSVGCLFFELLTGRPPFVGDSAVAIAYQHVREFPPKAVSLNSAVPPVYDIILTKALAKDVNNRYPDAGQFVIDLEYAIKGMPVSPSVDPSMTRVLTPNEVNQISGFAAADPTQFLDPVTNFGPPTGGDEDDLQQLSDEFAQEAKKKKKVIVITTVLAILAVVGVVVFLLFSGILAPKEDPKVIVPKISDTVDQAKGCNLIEDAHLKCEIVDDKDSAKEKGKLTKQDPSDGTEVDRNSVVKLYYSTGPAEGTIPTDIQGETFADAKKKLEGLGYIVTVKDAKDARVVSCVNPSTLSADEEIALNQGACSVEKDQVAGTKPLVGSKANKGTTVAIYLSDGEVTVPNLIGQSKEAAIKLAAAMGLKVVEDGEEINEEVVAGGVSTQEPASGKDVATKSAIKIKVAKAEDKVTVPGNLAGMSYEYAAGTLSGLGFVAVKIDGDRTSDKNLDAKVQSVVDAGNAVKKGSQVGVKVWKYVAKCTITGKTSLDEDDANCKEDPKCYIGSTPNPAYTSKEACEAKPTPGGTWK
ncbi:serine/threonine protein kinase [Actinomycetota bacterium]|nr:serine/threonine protein kinase [Actinomycetota bacterium]